MIDTGIIITGIIGIVTSIVSAWTSWFFARKKYNSEVEGTVIDNMQESLEFYKKLSDDNKNRLELLQEENIDLRKQVSVLQTQMFELMNQICLNLSCTHRITSKIKLNDSKNTENCEKK